MNFTVDTYGTFSSDQFVATSLVNPIFGTRNTFNAECIEDELGKIHSISTLIEVEQYLQTIASQYGFCFYTDYTTFPQTDGKKHIINVISQKTAWSRHYRENNFLLSDPSIRLLKHSCTPYIWDKTKYCNHLKHMLHIDEDKVVVDALDFSMTQIVNLPFHTGDGGISLVRFIRFFERPLSDRNCYRFIRDVYYLLCILAEKKFSLLRQEASQVDNAVHISSREKDILCRYATGNSPAQIAETLHISEHTVRNHLRNIREKFRVKNINQAIAIAIECSLIAI